MVVNGFEARIIFISGEVPGILPDYSEIRSLGAVVYAGYVGNAQIIVNCPVVSMKDEFTLVGAEPIDEGNDEFDDETFYYLLSLVKKIIKYECPSCPLRASCNLPKIKNHAVSGQVVYLSTPGLSLRKNN